MRSRVLPWTLPALLAVLLAATPAASEGTPSREDPVIALSFRGEHRAYPLRLFSGPRVVNDVVGSMEVAVFHDPGRGFSAAWFRTVYGEPIEFSGGTDGTVADDLTTASRWDLESGEAVGGSLKGQHLIPVPFRKTSWGDLVAAYPAAQPFAPEGP